MRMHIWIIDHDSNAPETKLSLKKMCWINVFLVISQRDMDHLF